MKVRSLFLLQLLRLWIKYMSSCARIYVAVKLFVVVYNKNVKTEFIVQKDFRVKLLKVYAPTFKMNDLFVIISTRNTI